MNSFYFNSEEDRVRALQCHDQEMAAAVEWVRKASPHFISLARGAIGLARDENDTSALVCLPEPALQMIARLADTALRELMVRACEIQEDEDDGS